MQFQSQISQTTALPNIPNNDITLFTFRPPEEFQLGMLIKRNNTLWIIFSVFIRNHYVNNHAMFR